MIRALSVLALLLALSACAETVDDTRTAIREWCLDTPAWCNKRAVK